MKRVRALYDEVPVRDGLAGERTILAAERTFLAYVRTAFAMFVAGLTGAHLLEPGFVLWVSYAVMGLGLITFVVGVARLRHSVRAAHRLLRRLESE